MNSQKAIAFLYAFVSSTLLHSGCEKSSNNGSVLIAVTYKGKALSHALVYIKADTLENPGIPLGKYDQRRSTNAKGQVFFEDLKEGRYYFYVNGYANENVWGEDSITVSYGIDPKMYEIRISTGQ